MPRSGLVYRPLLIQQDHTGADDRNYVRHASQPMPTQTTAQVLGMAAHRLHLNPDHDQEKAEQQNKDKQQEREQGREKERELYNAGQPFVMAMDHTNASNNKAYGCYTHPAPTQTTRQDRALVTPPYMVEFYNTSTVRAVSEALGTITSGGRHHGLVLPPDFDEAAARLCQQLGERQCAPFTLSYYSSGENVHPIQDALGTISTKDRHALITSMSQADKVDPISASSASSASSPFQGQGRPERLEVEDLYFRMIDAQETKIAMGFDRGYIITGTEDEQVHQSGNSVASPVAAELMTRGMISLEKSKV